MMLQDTSLNPAQLEASQILDGPALVLAGAGSGKTRVVTYRIANLLNEGVPADAILGLTFTNKAASEMQSRIQALTYQNVWISTFHSFGARILRESIDYLGYKPNFTIYDSEDSLKLLSTLLDPIGEKQKTKHYRALISMAKNDLKGPSDDLSDYEEDFLPDIYRQYQEALQKSEAVDFDDLLCLTVRLFQEHPDVLKRYQERWRFLLIDEYQDTNAAQYAMVKLLVKESQNIFVVGDPDQSIYGWRGADIHNILNFEKDFPGAQVIRLEQNYRSRENILEAANALISYNSERLKKNLWSARGSGDPIYYFQGYSELDEARFIAEKIDAFRDQGVPLNEIVVFYRTNFQSRPFEDQLLSRSIPYVIVGGISFYQRKEIKDILAYLRMVQSSSDFISFQRTINIPKRGIGSSTIEKIRNGADEANIPIYDYVQALLNTTPSPIRLNAKQREGLSSYFTTIDSLRDISKSQSLRSLVRDAIHETGYAKFLELDRETYEDRMGNLNELIAKADEWETLADEPSLSSFLEELSLKSTLDEVTEKEERISLMTLHNGKGLEFSLVFMSGMEEMLFPHVRAKDNPTEEEEERRLCYVGMTRAKDYLYLTSARQRFLWGGLRNQYPSRFIRDIPSKYLERIKEF